VVVHFGEASSKQVAAEMYVQLYRSKVQFYRKFGAARRANQFKRFVRIAYALRLACAALGRPFSKRLNASFQMFSYLLSELHSM
jgi:hypothetical protein